MSYFGKGYSQPIEIVQFQSSELSRSSASIQPLSLQLWHYFIIGFP
jgi:hypothetical protein